MASHLAPVKLNQIKTEAAIERFKETLSFKSIPLYSCLYLRLAAILVFIIIFDYSWKPEFNSF